MKQIFLSGKKGSVIGNYALVDDADFDWLSQWKWHYHCSPKSPENEYAYRKGNIAMHRVILGLTDRRIKGDHIDGNGLNNTRNNLRVATHAQNMANRVRRTEKEFSSKYKGVDKIKNGGNPLFRAVITKDKKVTIRCFKKELDAAKWYNEMSLKIHGEFANLNTIYDKEDR